MLSSSLSLSEGLGYLSILCWLGAQFPQIVVNYRTQSVEGLALPFLANWLFGDITNLVGCLLTDQLPFQIYLATYYCFCDACLVLQYLIYYKPSPPSHRHSYSTEPPTLRALSTAAANVAIAAAHAASEQEARLHGRLAPMKSGVYPEEGETEQDDDLMALTESFHSEDGRNRKHVAWGSTGASSTSTSRPPTATRPRSWSVDLARGRPLTREYYDYMPSDVSDATNQAQRPRSASVRKSSKASRRSASIVFLGVWALFGIGGLGRWHLTNKVEAMEQSVGVVLNPLPTTIAWSPEFHPDREQRPHPPPSPPPSMQRIIGRVSAWLCTTLYLTSRLPQIWKNFIRKSVEGLSVYLFLFAFLGNSFYVLALLTSPAMDLPPPGRIDFLKESLPYLLGSGGTLLFDVTIVSQVFVYRGRAPRRARSSFSRMASTAAEEEGLLPPTLPDTLAAGTARSRRRPGGETSIP